MLLLNFEIASDQTYILSLHVSFIKKQVRSSGVVDPALEATVNSYREKFGLPPLATMKEVSLLKVCVIVLMCVCLNIVYIHSTIVEKVSRCCFSLYLNSPYFVSTSNIARRKNKEKEKLTSYHINIHRCKRMRLCWRWVKSQEQTMESFQLC
jgi:hypothetical protein